MAEKHVRYELKQREMDGLVPRSVRIDSETRQLLIEATRQAGSQNNALKQALRDFLKNNNP